MHDGILQDHAKSFHYILLLITCIGNYYSLRGDHDKAVLYFKQGLSLNPKYLPAWTLLGHEYVELKNTSAAILSYRKATGIICLFLLET